MGNWLAPVRLLVGWTRIYLRRGAIAGFAKLVDLMTCRLRGLTPCIVYQMGKVGSTTVIDALNATGRIRAFQAHRLNPESIARNQQRFRAGETYYRDMIFERGLYRWLWRQRRPVKIVTILREPFSQTYSGFFQNLKRSTRGQIDPSTATVDTLKPYFLDWEDLGIATRWIETEYMPVLAHNPYSYPFDPALGWSVINTDRFEILIMKLELNDNEKTKLVAKFLDLEDVTMDRENIGENKPYAALYQRFRSEVRIPKETADKWVETRYVQHFFTPEEGAAARGRFGEK